MKCPHCLENFHDQPKVTPLGEDAEGTWATVSNTCPACKRFVLQLADADTAFVQGFGYQIKKLRSTYLFRPKASTRLPLPSDVPQSFSKDYNEACLVLSDSAKASAALSRRCLQHILRECAKVKAGSLADEIQQILDTKALPSYLSESVDAVRNIGNFAAHPLKSTNSGEVLDVEPGEAEWNLDVLESLFDFYFVQPKKLAARRDALNAKLKDAGKPDMKGA